MAYSAQPIGKPRKSSALSAVTATIGGTPAEVTLSFEGHVTQIHATGRVIGVTPSVGFGVKMLDLGEHQRSIIRTWVARAQA